MAILKTTLAGCDDGPSRQAFKALFPGDKEEKKKVPLFALVIFITRNKRQKATKSNIGNAISGSGVC